MNEEKKEPVSFKYFDNYNNFILLLFIIILVIFGVYFLYVLLYKLLCKKKTSESNDSNELNELDRVENPNFSFNLEKTQQTDLDCSINPEIGPDPIDIGHRISIEKEILKVITINYPPLVKLFSILIVGKNNVGKTTLCKTLHQNKMTLYPLDNKSKQPYGIFNETLFKTVKFNVNVDFKKLGKCSLDIIDMNGNDMGNLDDYIQQSQGFFLVFSIHEEKSFDCMKDLYDKIVKIKFSAEESKNAPLPICLVGLSCDFIEELNLRLEEAKILADSFRIPFYTANNNNQEQVRALFEKLADMIEKYKNWKKKN